MRRPGEMLGNQRRFVALDQRPKAFDMDLVQRLRTADRHADAVHGHRIVATNGFQRTMG